MVDGVKLQVQKLPVQPNGCGSDSHIMQVTVLHQAAYFADLDMVFVILSIAIVS